MGEETMNILLWKESLFHTSIQRESKLSDFLIFYQIFPLPQVKRIMIISNKHGVYELPQELSNDLRLRKLGNIKKIPSLRKIIA